MGKGSHDAKTWARAVVFSLAMCARTTRGEGRHRHMGLGGQPLRGGGRRQRRLPPIGPASKRKGGRGGRRGTRAGLGLGQLREEGEGGKEACGPAGSWANRPKVRNIGGEKRFCFSFSIALFQIHFQKVF
jgi:hypothetical protein